MIVKNIVDHIGNKPMVEVNSLNQNPKLKLTANPPDSNKLFPVTLPVTEAFECIKLIIAKMADSKRVLFPKLKDLKLHPVGAGIVYLPFIRRGIDLVQPEMQFAVHHASIRDKTRLEDIC